MKEAYGPYERSAEIYDLLYAEIVDFDANAQKLRQLIGERNPGAQTLLEVACGTGAYLERLTGHYTVSGLDVSPAMLERARRRLPDVPLFEADMADFDLGENFDVVACLFSSIAYILTVEALRSTIACFARHTVPGGLVIVEPWFAPDQWQEGYVATVSARNDDIAVARASASRRDGRLAAMTLGFVVARASGEVETYTEEHVTGQFTVDEHLSAFEDAELEVEYDPEGLIGRGLYVATRR